MTKESLKSTELYKMTVKKHKISQPITNWQGMDKNHQQTRYVGEFLEYGKQSEHRGKDW